MGKGEIGRFLIAPIEQAEHYRSCLSIQNVVWGFEAKDAVTPAMLATCVQYGGILLGAFDPRQELVGFVFSLPALWEGAEIQHSHLLAVLPAFRNRGVGKALKLAQHDQALKRGIRLITWTFDPLEAKNAHLNLNLLGVSVRRYYRDLYGQETGSELHRGLGTDRFLAEWPVPLQEKDVRHLPPTRELQAVQTRWSSSSVLYPVGWCNLLNEDTVFAEIPYDIQSLKHEDISAARRWREVTRQVFEHYLARGYEIHRTVVLIEENRRRSWYQLDRAREGDERGGRDHS